MPYYNKSFLWGHAGRDAELKYGKSGTPYTKFSLAVSDTENGEKRTDWFDIVCFNKTAEFSANDVTKGASVFVEGKISFDKWEKDGVKHEKVVIKASVVKVANKKKQEKEDATQTFEDNAQEMPF